MPIDRQEIYHESKEDQDHDDFDQILARSIAQFIGAGLLVCGVIYTLLQAIS